MSSKSRNYGYGRRLDYAGVMALQERYGDGHYATLRTHSSRWRPFALFCRGELDLNDMRGIEASHIKAYHDLALQNASVITKQCHISTLNVVINHASRGLWQPVSPSGIAGSRTSVRRTIPVYLDTEIVDYTVSSLAKRLPRVCAILLLALAYGMRRREAILADLTRLLGEAYRCGHVNVQDGPKGGRAAPRWVPVSSLGLCALHYALAVRPDKSRNLLSSSETIKSFLNGTVSYGYDLIRSCGGSGFHDARAAYACHRYEDLTGVKAPVIYGGRVAESDTDYEARAQIFCELGHARLSVLTTYVGTRRCVEGGLS